MAKKLSTRYNKGTTLELGGIHISIHNIRSKLLGTAAILFLVIGLVLVIYPKWSQYNEYQRELRLLTEWGDFPAATVSSHPLTTSSEPSSRPTNTFSPKIIDGHAVYGTVNIPKIDLREPMVEGATQESLKLGSGIVVPDRMPGEVGNFVLASHRSLTFGRHYNRLDELEVGDSIDLETSDQIHTYTVESKFIVTPDDLSVLEQNEEDSELTLITCEPIDTATHRLIVKAKMEKKTN